MPLTSIYLQALMNPAISPGRMRAISLILIKGYIKDRIESALPIHLSAVVILREIKEKSYDGGITPGCVSTWFSYAVTRWPQRSFALKQSPVSTADLAQNTTLAMTDLQPVSK